MARRIPKEEMRKEKRKALIWPLVSLVVSILTLLAQINMVCTKK